MKEKTLGIVGNVEMHNNKTEEQSRAIMMNPWKEVPL